MKRKKATVVSIAVVLALFFCRPYRADADFSKTSEYGGNIVMPPTVVAELTSNASVASAIDNKADNALMWVEGSNATARDGTVISLLDGVVKQLSENVISCFYIDDEEDINQIASYSTANAFYDFTVLSPDAELIGSIKKRVPEARAMLDLKDDVDVKRDIAVSNRAGANGVVIDLGSASKETIFKFQSVAKTVWVSGIKTQFDALKGLSSGAFGLIGDPAAIRGAFDKFDGKSMTILPRSPINAAHRGDPYICNENSLEGCESAVAGGATHIELDFRLTRDGEIVVMHDGEIGRTTDGTGVIESLTMSELKNYSIIKTMSGSVTGVRSKIPTADDVFAFMREHDVYLLLEIKSEGEALITKLKQKIDQYDIADRIVVISFLQNQLMNARKLMPEIWALDLNTGPADTGENVMRMARAQIGYDCINSVFSPQFVKSMADRCYMPIFWTYDRFTDYINAMWNGVYFITNNSASDAGTVAVGVEAYITEQVSEGDEVPIKVLYGDGVGVDDMGTVIAASGDEAVIVGEIDNNSYALITAKISSPAAGKKGCKGCGSFMGSGALPWLILSAAIFIRNKRGM